MNLDKDAIIQELLAQRDILGSRAAQHAGTIGHLQKLLAEAQKPQEPSNEPQDIL